MSFLKSVVALGAGLMVGVSAQAADVKLSGAGATFPAPIYQRWISEYQKSHPEVKIDYVANGSGAGIGAITKKVVDFGASDAPLSKKDIVALGGDDKVVQIPTVAGAVVVAFNLPGYDGDLKLDGPAIADIFLGNIKKWNDAKIAALNPGAKLPDLGITPVYRTDGSGTNYIFTNYLSGQSADFATKVGAGKAVEWPTGQGGKGNDGVTAIIHDTKGAVGFVELAYALQNKVPFADLKNKDGEFVKATADSVSAAGEGAVSHMDKSLAVNIWDQPGKKAYPISSFTYIIVYKDLAYLNDASKAKTLVDFLSWATSDGEKLAASLDYAPLSDGVQKKVAAVIGELTWDGKAVKPVAVAK